jgi:hypothetical protein
MKMKTFGSRTGKHRSALAAVIAVMCVVLAGAATLKAQKDAPAEAPSVVMMNGLIDDFSPVLDANGPWQVSGLWSITLRGVSGRGDFSAALNMARADNLNRSQHTHHVMLVDEEITPLANGFQISGNAVITSNGNLAGFSGSPVTVVVTGGSAVPLSNITVTFGGAAVGHLGDQPYHGFVAPR